MKALQKHIIGIIGYGRFGKVWADLFLEKGYTVMIYDPYITIEHMEKTSDSLTLIQQADLRKADIVFFCVPISLLQESIKETLPVLSEHAIVCDTCSVKIYPMQWMREQLPQAQSIVGLHPLFGPDSVHIKNHRTVIVCRERISDEQYTLLLQIITSIHMNIEEISSEEHDTQAVYSQGLTHLLGRVLEKLPLEKKAVSTKGFESLLEIIEQTCEDSHDLFLDIQRYNIGGQKMYADLQIALEETIAEIIAVRDDENTPQ